MLTDYLNTNIYQFMLVYIRVGAALLAMPGIGGTLVQVQTRLWLGMTIAFAILPVAGPLLPPQPHQPGAMLALIFGEAVIGLFLGTVAQGLMASLDVAGTFIGFQTGLTNAFSFDAIAQQQSQLLTSFMSNLALAVVFASNAHHLMLRAIVDSYDVFAPGAALPLDDFATTLGHLVTHAFQMGLRLAAPLLVFGLVFQSGMGILSRLVPQMQVYFIAMPIQLLMGLWILMVSLPVVMMLFVQDFAQGLGPFLK